MNLSKLNQIVCQMLANGQKNASVEETMISIGVVRPTEIKISSY